MELNLIFNNIYAIIVLCIIAITGLIISIIAFVKPDVEIRLSGGILDPNAMTIDEYLESEQGIEYMNDYLLTKFPNFFVKKDGRSYYLKVVDTGNKLAHDNSGSRIVQKTNNSSTVFQIYLN